MERSVPAHMNAVVTFKTATTQTDLKYGNITSHPQSLSERKGASERADGDLSRESVYVRAVQNNLHVIEAPLSLK